MIAPDTSRALRHGRPFDLLAAVLIGTIAVLASVLGVIEIRTGQQATRAQLEAARLTADLSGGLQVGGLVEQAIASEMQAASTLGLEGANRGLIGYEQGDDAAFQIGSAETAAADALDAALAATAETVGGPPLDAYTARLVNATTEQLTAEVGEQNRQVDLADAADTRNTRSTLGLSFLALAGVLTGLGAVLHEVRAGWFSLLAAAGMSAAAAVLAILAVV